MEGPKTKEEREKRKAEMMALQQKGMLLEAIGRRYGISKQRVAQILGHVGNVHLGDVRGYGVQLTKPQRAHWVGRAKAEGILPSMYIQKLIESDMKECAAMERLRWDVMEEAKVRRQKAENRREKG